MFIDLFPDEDECSVNNSCHINATCNNIPGSFVCTCNTGFSGNQTYCEGKSLDATILRHDSISFSICIRFNNIAPGLTRAILSDF